MLNDSILLQREPKIIMLVDTNTELLKKRELQLFNNQNYSSTYWTTIKDLKEDKDCRPYFQYNIEGTLYNLYNSFYHYNNRKIFTFTTSFIESVNSALSVVQEGEIILIAKQ